jgi:hypothetical protein
MRLSSKKQGSMARGGHGLPKFSTGPAMPYPSTPCGRATLETKWQNERPAGVFYPFGHPTPYAYDEKQ